MGVQLIPRPRRPGPLTAFLIGVPLVLVASLATYHSAFQCDLTSHKWARLYYKLLIEPGEFVICWIPYLMTLGLKRTELMPT